MKQKIWIFIVGFALSHSPAKAIDFGTNLGQAEIDGLTSYLSALTLFHQLKGPSRLGEIWGVDFGLQVSAASTAPLKEAVSTISGANIPTDFLPAGMIMGRVGFPFSGSVEFGFIPTISAGGSSLGMLAFGGRWSWAEFFELPWGFTGDARFHWSNTSFSYEDVISPPAVTTVSMGFSSWGLTTSVGYPWTFGLFTVEPYLGGGFAALEGDFAGAVSAGVVSGSIGNAEVSKMVGHFQAGVDFKLAVVRLVLEYDLIGFVHKGAVSLVISI